MHHDISDYLRVVIRQQGDKTDLESIRVVDIIFIHWQALDTQVNSKLASKYIAVVDCQLVYFMSKDDECGAGQDIDRVEGTTRCKVIFPAGIVIIAAVTVNNMGNSCI